MRILATIALWALALASSAVQAKDYDICVIGAGAGGTAAAVYGTRRGYSVLLVDSQRSIGGHCDTYNYVRPDGTQSWIDTGVAQLADTQKINEELGPLPNGKPRWQANTKKYVKTFVPDVDNYLIPLDIPGDDFTNKAAIYAVDEGLGVAAGPVFDQSQLPHPNDTDAQDIFKDLFELTHFTYPWLDNGELEGPVPAELLIPFGQFMAERGWTKSPAMMNLFSAILWYAVAMDKFDTLTTVYALRFLAPTPQKLFADKHYWYGFQGGCQRLYDAIHANLQSHPCNDVLVSTTITSIVRPNPSPLLDWLIKPKITVQGYTIGTQNGATTNKTFTHKCGSVIFGMPAVPASLARMGLQLSPTETAVFGTVTTHTYVGAAVASTGRAINETWNINKGLYNILHVNFQDPPFNLSPGDPTWISLQGNYGASWPSYSLLAGFSTNELSQQEARAIMQEQLNAHLTQPMKSVIDETITPPLLDTANIVAFGAHRYQARPALSQLSRSDGWYSAVNKLQGHKNTYWTGATVNFPLHHVCINEAYKLIHKHFPDKCNPRNLISYIICLAKGRLVNWDL